MLIIILAMIAKVHSVRALLMLAPIKALFAAVPKTKVRKTTLLTRCSLLFYCLLVCADYALHSDCVWRIEPANPPSGSYSVRLRFQQFATELDYDTVEVWDGVVDAAGSFRVALLSGKPDITRSYTASSGVLSVRFRSDYSITDKGFVAEYEVLQCDQNCNGHGICMDPTSATSQCACEHGYGGAVCELDACFPNCSGHGTCVANANDDGEKCVCTGGFEGPWCSECKVAQVNPNKES